MSEESARGPDRRVECDAEADPVMLRVTGIYDQKAAEDVEALVAKLDAGAPVVMCLSDVEYLSSSGIGQIVHLASRFRLVLADPSPIVVQILKLAEVWPLLSVEENEMEAQKVARDR